MSNRQLAAIIARRKAIKAARSSENQTKVSPMLAACLDAAGFSAFPLNNLLRLSEKHIRGKRS